MISARRMMKTGYGHGATKYASEGCLPLPDVAAGDNLGRHARRVGAVLAALVVWIWGTGAPKISAQTVTLNYLSAPTLVANTGLSEELGAIVLSADGSCGTAVDALCVSVAGSLQVTYTDMVIENTVGTGITVCESLSGISVCNAAGSFLTGTVTVGSTAQGGVVSIGIIAGANFAIGDQVTIAGVRSRIDQTPLAVPDTSTTAVLTVAPVAALNFSPTLNLIARSADPVSFSVMGETWVPCGAGDAPAVLEIREEYPTAFVDHGDAGEATYPGAPAHARPLFGATNNSQVKLFLEGLDPGISIQWPASVPANMGVGVLDLVSQTANGSEALYVYGTADQGQSDVTPEIFELQLAPANFTFSGHDPIQGHVTVQGQLLPPPSPDTVRPRYDHPLEPTPGVSLLKLRRCNVTTGIVQVYAVVGGIFWFGNLDYELVGPTPLLRSKVPDQVEALQPGVYTVNYVAGGPAGATFNGTVQSQTQTLAAGETIIFTLSFSGPTIAQLELRSTPASVCPSADTAVGGFELVNTTDELQIIQGNAQFTFTFSRPVVAPFVASGPATFTSPVAAGASITVGLRNRVPLSPGEALTFSGARLNLAGVGDGQVVTVQLTALPSSAIQLTASQATVAVTDSSLCQPPSFAAEDVVNAASLRSGIEGVSAGSIGAILGTNLSHVSGVVLATKLPLPRELAGVVVTVNGIAAPLFSVANVGGEEQITFQVPWEAGSPQELNPLVTIVVNNNGSESDAVEVLLLSILPAIFTVDGTVGAILHGEGMAAVSASNPAAPGDEVVIYATGLGPGIRFGEFPPVVETGSPAPPSPPISTLITPTAMVGGLPAGVLFSGYAPGFVGLYEVRVQLPSAVPSGSQDVVLRIFDGLFVSKPVKISIR